MLMLCDGPPRSNVEASVMGVERTMGVPQGSVIGPVLANLFLTYVFDKWMAINFPTIPFERYADDTICHCRTEKQAQYLKACLVKRFADCGLKLNEEKTKIVYCKDSNRKGNSEHTSFDFLGYTFRPRAAGRDGFQLGVASIPGQQLGIVGYIEERIDPLITVEGLEAIDALGGTVDGLLLGGLECQCAVAQLLGGIDDGYLFVLQSHAK